MPNGECMKTSKNIIISCVIGVLCACLGVGINMYVKNSSTSNQTSVKVFTESSLNDYQTLTLEYSNSEVDTLSYLKDTKDASVFPTSISLLEVGEKQITYTIGDEVINCTFVIKDTKAPVITLNSDTVEVDALDGFDLNSNVQSVEDPIDGTLVKFETEPEKLTDSTDGKVYDTGWYTVTNVDNTVTVHASDNHGNTTEQTYTIQVKESKDTETHMYSYQLVDLSGMEDESNWQEIDSNDWYYSACSYHSSKYQTVDEALQDVVNHEASIGNTDDVENEARIFCVKNSEGKVLYYQAGFEE